MRICVLFLLVAGVAMAEDDELDSLLEKNNALLGAQQTLTDPAKRIEAAKDPKAAAAMSSLEKLAGTPKNAQGVYELAADVLGSLAKEAGGDPAKMMDLLQKGAANPEAFGMKFTPEQRAKLRDLAKAIEGGKIP